MTEFRLLIFERQYYLPLEEITTNVFKCSPQEIDMHFSQYNGKKIQKIYHSEETWVSCKSIYYFISWFLDNSYSLNPEISSFRHDISKYIKLTPKRAMSRALRVEIAYRQAYKCNSCSLFPIPPDFHVDHIIALEDGGQDIAENLQALCVACHSEKTRLNRLRKTQHFAKQAEKAHNHFQPDKPVFSKYFRK